jgi:hypothetical protein
MAADASTTPIMDCASSSSPGGRPILFGDVTLRPRPPWRGDARTVSMIDAD